MTHSTCCATKHSPCVHTVATTCKTLTNRIGPIHKNYKSMTMNMIWPSATIKNTCYQFACDNLDTIRLSSICATKHSTLYSYSFNYVWDSHQQFYIFVQQVQDRRRLHGTTLHCYKQSTCEPIASSIARLPRIARTSFVANVRCCKPVQVREVMLYAHIDQFKHC